MAAASSGSPAPEQGASARVATAADRLTLTLLYGDDFYGRFRAIDCGGHAPPGSDFANWVGAADAIRREVTSAGQPEPIVVSAGDMLGPKPLARFVLAQGDEGGERVAGWLARGGFDVIGLGNNDFASVPERLRRFLRAAPRKGLRVSAGNLKCSEPDLDICRSVRHDGSPFWMLERAGLEIAVFGLLATDVRDDAPANHLPGVDVENPFERGREIVADARAAGADLVIVLAHLDHPDTAPKRTVLLAQKVPDADLIVASSLHAGAARGMVQVRFADRGARIVGGDAEARQVGRVTLTIERAGGRARIVDADVELVDASSAPPDPELAAQLSQAHDEYCAQWGQPVGDAKLAHPMDEETFADYALEVMRQATRTEIAFAHRAMVESISVFPITQRLTRHDFFAGLPQRNHVYTFEISGQALIGLCARIAKQGGEPHGSDLLSRGLTCGSTPKVNGRPIDPQDSYDAATIEHLAKGAFGYFTPEGGAMHLYDPEHAPEAPILGELVRDYLSGPRFSGPGAELIDLDTNFPDLYDQLRWTFRGDVDFNLADSRIHNPSHYDDQAQLTQDQVLAVRTEARGRIAADSRSHGLSLEGRLKYALTDTNAQGFSESDDLASVDLLYRLRALKAAHDHWWVPLIYLGGTLETELTPPRSDEGRDFRHLETTGTTGLRLTILPQLEAKIGFGARRELLDPEARSIFGGELGYELTRTSLASILGSPVQLESVLSAFVGGGPEEDVSLKGTWVNRLYFSLAGGIAFNVTHDLFFFSRDSSKLGYASQLTIGISYHADASIQSFLPR